MNLKFLITGQNFAENDAGEYVAIKILKDGVSNEVKEDFEREVDIMSAFDHENILKLIGIIQRGLLKTYTCFPFTTSIYPNKFCKEMRSS